MPIRLTALLLLVFGAGFLLEASRYPFGSPNAPGPGFLPIILGTAFTLLSLVLLIRPGHVPKRVLPPDREAAVRVVATVVGLALALLLLERLGFIVVGTGMLLGLLLVLDRRPVRALVMAPLASLAVYVVFKIWLRVPLPGGLVSF